MQPTQVLDLGNRLSELIIARRPFVVTACNYYRGEEGRMKFASDEFKDYFERRFTGFSDNWCAPVAQAPIERIGFQGIRLDGATQTDPDLAKAWERNDGDRYLSEALLLMTIVGRSFILVSPQNGGRLTFESPDSAAVLYDGLTGKRRAGLVLNQDDRNEYATLLVPGKLVRLQRDKNGLVGGERVTAPDAGGWQFTTGNWEKSFADVPLIEMRNQALLDNKPISDIAGVMPMQDTINLVWAYTLNSLDYISLPARVVMNGEAPTEDIFDEDGNKIGEKDIELDSMIRDRVSWLEGEGIQIGEWKPGNVDGFAKVIESAVAHIAAQTRTPSHYLLSANGNTPAAGYELAEAGLVSKANERMAFAAPAIKEAHRLLAIASGQTVKAEQIATGKVLWRKPQYRSEAQLVDGLAKLRGIGFPMEFIAEEYGLAPSDISRVMKMIEAEKELEKRDQTMEAVAKDLFNNGDNPGTDS